MSDFRVFGTVRDAGSGDPLEGLVVQAFDKDMVFDDRLGEAVTDVAGKFEIRFTSAAFRELLEQRPDVFVRVCDRTGLREITNTLDAIRRNAGPEEEFEIEIDPDSLPLDHGV